jgi:hypothetical protein
VTVHELAGGRHGDPFAEVERLRPVSLAEANDAAEALIRVDRKYVVSPSVVATMIASCAERLAVLDIESDRRFPYHSQYFDTDDFALHRAAATKRRRRFKVRTRTYGNGLVMLEVKAKDGRGRTVKHRVEHSGAPTELGDTAQRYITEVTGAHALVPRLRPSLTTDYERATVVDAAAGCRATIDRSLVCTATDGRTVRLDHAAIVETKSAASAGPLDRWLWSAGIRPVRISKYCTALGVLYPELPSNAWHRTIATHF